MEVVWYMRERGGRGQWRDGVTVGKERSRTIA